VRKNAEQRRVTERRLQLEELAAAGVSQAEAARVIGATRAKVCRYAARFGIRFSMERRNLKRECQILAAKCQGVTLAEIGRQHGIDREQVRQILRRNGVGPAGAWATRRESP
jgi:alcohol dehydrogenase YqhD (iron-dependent ADH family)